MKTFKLMKATEAGHMKQIGEAVEWAESGVVSLHDPEARETVSYSTMHHAAMALAGDDCYLVDPEVEETYGLIEVVDQQ